MGLRVWLPLNGSVENQGLSTLSITNSGAATDTAGKIGSCYSFNGSSAYMRTAFPAANYVTKPFSVAFWVYFNNVTNNACICSSRTGVNYGFSIFRISNYLRLDNGTNSAQSLCKFSSYTFSASKWYHVVCIQKATSRELYVDGVLRQTANYGIPASNTAQYLLVGAASSTDSTPTGNYLNGKLNDFRLYDHALSVKEIEEVARGLAIHYKLDKLNGTKVVDCSGFKNHGTATNITIANSSPRYTASSQLPQSASAIQVGNFSTVVSNGNFTFNVWFKKVTGEWSSKSWETVLGGPSGFELEGKIRATTYNYIHPYSWGGGGTDTPNSYSFEYSLDEWHMLTMTRTASATKFYLDGVLKVTGTAGSIPSGNYFLGSWRDTTSQNYRGYLSDARVYVTVLTDKQILELYNESAAIARDGTTFAREFVEATL